MVPHQTEEILTAERPTPSADPLALGELRERIEKAAKHIAPAWMRDRVDDLVQMALMKLMRSGKGANDVNQTFVYRTVHSVVVDEIRRHRRRNETDIDQPGATPVVERDVRCNPEVMAGGKEIGVAIVECLAKLADERRRAVTLYLQGHGVPDIARLLGFKPKRAENLVYRGLSELRSHLRKAGFQP